MASFDDQLDEFAPPTEMLTYTAVPLATRYNLYLTDVIGAPQNYLAWFELLRSVGSSDEVHIYINCIGGAADTAMQLIQAMDECSARIIVHVEGYCMSAATWVMLRADEVILSDFCRILIHNYHGAKSGKGAEMFSSIKAEREWSQHVVRSIYKDFLTYEEIERVLEDHDENMDSNEVRRRLALRDAKRLTTQKKVDKTEEVD